MCVYGCLGGDGGGVGWGYVLMYGEKLYGLLQDLNLGDKFLYWFLVYFDLLYGFLLYIFFSFIELVVYLGKFLRCFYFGEVFCICY